MAQELPILYGWGCCMDICSLVIGQEKQAKEKSLFKSIMEKKVFFGIPPTRMSGGQLWMATSLKEKNSPLPSNSCL